jgi:hypothetical protein
MDRPELRGKTRLPERAKPKTKWQKVQDALFGSTLAKIRTVAATTFSIGLALWGAYQNTIPEVAARDADDHSYVLPFIIFNRSSLFDMTDVSTTCAFGSFFLQEKRGNTVSMVASLSSSQKNERIKAGKQANFPCDVSGFISYEVPMSSRGPRVNAPREPARQTITHIDTSITVNYTTAGFWHRTFKSDPFSWDRDAKGFHWIRGNVLR